MPRAVARPYMLRPPVFLRISTRLFSGFVFVISLKSANEMYRVDGVSGLNVFTGIKSTIQTKSATWRAEPLILRPDGLFSYRFCRLCCSFARKRKERRK